ncbi:MAG: SCP2 sterol-binding domain-containing protein [Rhodobacteraceae bacterium]|nr:SCP2 sterol-binding domain-containing protein [Paracoccaceae bacterium]
MTDAFATISLVPQPLSLGLLAVPLAPMSVALSLLAGRVIRGHPGLLDRLGDYGGRRFVIDPTDLPLCLLIQPNAAHGAVRLHRQPPSADARIAGPLAALLGLVHGTWDGDALFFSRDLVIEGDTSAALALRNAIDDAELDLGAEISTLVGPFGQMLRQVIAFAERRTGMPLRRMEEPG